MELQVPVSMNKQITEEYICDWILRVVNKKTKYKIDEVRFILLEYLHGI